MDTGMLPGKGQKVSIEKTLQSLFLKLFLRGHSLRGTARQGVPTSIASRLGMTLFVYGIMGVFFLFFIGQPVYLLSLYSHGLTLLMLGVFLVASSGEVLFNKEEVEILLHRPVEPSALLRAKAKVLIQVSLYIAAAMNLFCLAAGVFAKDGGWLFPIVHSVSTFESAIFCMSCVVLVYQVCLRWFGREKLENVMTFAQVLLMIGMTIGTQLVPRFLVSFQNSKITFTHAWWLDLLPPTWFASLDDAIAGSRQSQAWALSVVGFAATGLAAWLAFGKLASSYQSGIQSMSEATAPRRSDRSQHRFLQVVARIPPLSWLLRGSVNRAAFVLAGAYLFRDRETKLRIYPGLAPFLVIPVILLFSPDHGSASKIVGPTMLSFAAVYSGVIPMVALNMLKYSQQWRASDVFIVAPLSGPAPLHRGAQVAVTTLLALPMFVIVALFVFLMAHWEGLALMAAGALILPAYAAVPSLLDPHPLLSRASEEANTASRGITMFGAMIVAIVVGFVSAFAWTAGFYVYFLICEAVVSIAFCMLVNALNNQRVWAKE